MFFPDSLSLYSSWTSAASTEKEEETMEDSLIIINAPTVEEDPGNNGNTDVMLPEHVVADRDCVNKGTKPAHIPPTDSRVLQEL